MDELKEFVGQHRKDFTKDKPLPGHWFRFQSKAYWTGKGKHSISFAQWASSSAAAVLLFAAMLPVLWTDNSHVCNHEEPIVNNGRYAESHPEPLEWHIDLFEEPDHDTLNHRI